MLVVVLVLCCLTAHSQTDTSQSELEVSAKNLFEQEHWPELVQRLEHAARPTADLNYYYGVALAHLERWEGARAALASGARLAPTDKRFPIELAGVDFRQKRFTAAKRHLRRALKLAPGDSYANDFLGTIYFLESNFEAALKYWNRVAKPEIAEVRCDPPVRIRPALLDHAFAFAPSSILTLDQLLTSQARARQLEIFSSHRFELIGRAGGKFDAVFRSHELNGFGNTKIEALFRTFGGIIFQEITPEYYNVHGSATNIVTLLRWDTDKRRAYAWLSGALGANPNWRYRFGSDLRNENWTVQTSFTGPSLFLGAFNMRREALAAEIGQVVGARWSWTTGVEFSHRDFRNISAGTTFAQQLLLKGYQVKQTAQLNYELWRSPERRITVSSVLSSQAGRIWSEPGHAFEKIQASIDASWFPRAVGEDYETRSRLSAGKTFGDAPFDELFMLAAERDNNLWLRGHEGTRDGEKGSAPMGSEYVLSNWQIDREVYSNGFLTLKLGPFLDMGKIWDQSPALGSHKWLFDTGAQARLRVLGVDVVLIYGKDLRSGNNTYFATVKP